MEAGAYLGIFRHKNHTPCLGISWEKVTHFNDTPPFTILGEYPPPPPPGPNHYITGNCYLHTKIDSWAFRRQKFSNALPMHDDHSTTLISSAVPSVLPPRGIRKWGQSSNIRGGGALTCIGGTGMCCFDDPPFQTPTSVL